MEKENKMMWISKPSVEDPISEKFGQQHENLNFDNMLIIMDDGID
jgi:hypothetical protein